MKEAVAKAAGIDLEKWKHEQHGGHGNPVAVSPDGKYSIEFVECLASCGSAPVAMVDDLFKENVAMKDAEKLLKLKTSDATTPKVLAPHPREKRIVFKNIDREGWTNDIEIGRGHV